MNSSVKLILRVDLNIHLKKIRIEQEPNKKFSKSVESNSAYISKKF